MKNRRTFLKTACKPIVLAAFGIPLLEACAKDEATYTPSAGGQSQSTPEDQLRLIFQVHSLLIFRPLVGG
jgi:hypothetical protein